MSDEEDQRGLLDLLRKALIERALNSKMDHHPGGDEQANRPPARKP